VNEMIVIKVGFALVIFRHLSDLDGQDSENPDPGSMRKDSDSSLKP
jgi:hypothetical protein